MSAKIEPFVTGEPVWIRSCNMKKAAIGIVGTLGVDSASGQEWAEIAMLTDYYDWDHDNSSIKTTNQVMVQYPCYRLEHIKY